MNQFRGGLDCVRCICFDDHCDATSSFHHAPHEKEFVLDLKSRQPKLKHDDRAEYNKVAAR